MIRAAHHSGTQSRINRIVIHCTVSPCAPGWANKIAKYFQSPSSGGSAHYVVDPEEIVQCLPDNVIAWHAPPNTGSVGIELCDWQKGDPKRWNDSNHQNMLRLAAPLVRSLANKYDIPLKWLTVAELRAGHRGICGHVDVSRAWGKTDHGDPHMAGPFPTSAFMSMVKNGDDDDMPSPKDFWNHETKVAFGTKENPEWQIDSILADIANSQRKIIAAVEKLTAALESRQ
jgi:N-acetylmuramoyl-L-alanine amidase